MSVESRLGEKKKEITLVVAARHKTNMRAIPTGAQPAPPTQARTCIHSLRPQRNDASTAGLMDSLMRLVTLTNELHVIHVLALSPCSGFRRRLQQNGFNHRATAFEISDTKFTI